MVKQILNSSFSAVTATDQLKVGDKVVVCGKLIKFYEKSEMAQGNKLISLNGKKAETGGGEEKPGGGEVTPPAPTGDNLLANGNWKLGMAQLL